jgi:hypothetical protein
VHRRRTQRARQATWALALLPLVLAACSSGSASSSAGSPDAALRAAGAAVESHMSAYAAAAQACTSKPSPVVCLETADRTLGGQIHDYANVLATRHDFSAPQADLTTARNAAQTLANSLEILGDAQPTQANYDRVRNTFDVGAAIGQLRRAVDRLDSALGR